MVSHFCVVQKLASGGLIGRGGFGILSIPPVSRWPPPKKCQCLVEAACCDVHVLSVVQERDPAPAIGVSRRPYGSIGVILDTVSRGLPSWPDATAGQQMAIANPKLDDHKPVEITTALSLAQLSE